jgi:outer membrane protein OmpA-like peptidoglycan-associated protein
MKMLLLLLTACTLIYSADAQVLKRLGDRAKQKLERKAGDKVDDAIDKSVDDATKPKPKSESDETSNKSENGSSTSNTANSGKTGSLKSYSRYDFVPGDKILYAEDFSQDAIGEFPAKWNTNGSGEVVTIEGLPGKWLKLQESTKYESALKNNLPENYTVEFDMIAEYKDDQAVPWVNVILQGDLLPNYSYGIRTQLGLALNNGTSENADAVYYESLNEKGITVLQANKRLHSGFHKFNHKQTPVHVAIWVQKERFRAWVNDEKLYDLPKGVPTTSPLNKLIFDVTNYGGNQENWKYFISNIKVAAALPDTRSKLITEGKWSTTGILFDVNSDKIKPTSYGTLKQIASVLSENADVKVKIIGHTDTDGKDDANLELSKKRAVAVKQALVSEFNIDGDRLQTDGAGESKPVADNNTPEGKAQNRRVEFVKL